MDISKASNFERFIFDLTERDASRVKELWRLVDKGGAFDLAATPVMGESEELGLCRETVTMRPASRPSAKHMNNMACWWTRIPRMV